MTNSEVHLIGTVPHLTARATADRLGLHVGSLANQRANGRSALPFTRIGNTVLYPLAAVERLAREGR